MESVCLRYEPEQPSRSVGLSRRKNLQSCGVSLVYGGGAGGLDYGMDPLELLWQFGTTNLGVYIGDVTISTVRADSGSSGSTTTTQFCGCLADLTSGVLGPAAPLPDALTPGVPYYSPGPPAGIEIVGFLFEYNGPNGLLDLTTGQVMVPPIVDSVPIGAFIDVNVWQEQIVDAGGIPVMPGNYTVQEALTTLSGNLTAESGTWPSNGSFVDNIGVIPDLLPGGFGFGRQQQTFSVDGVPMNTVFNQYVMYGQGTLGMAFPMACPCNP